MDKLDTLHEQIAIGGLLGGRYRLEERIGSGGMARIFRAWDEMLERPVAVKVLHAHLADDDDLLARFQTEARHAAALNHPSIVLMYDHGVADLPYIVMEYVDGPSLRDVLRERGRLSPAEALSVVAPVCEALARAHDAGVIHRDVKPENVLIGSDGLPKVADFGIARAVAGTSHTATGAVIGSVHYMAPELLDGREASAASDQYALGVVLFELLTGEKPLPGESVMAVAMRHARESIPAPSSKAAGTPAAVDAVVARATATAPAERYPDVRALAQALRNAVPDGGDAVEVRDGVSDTLVIPADAVDTEVVEPDRGRTRRRRRGLLLAGWLGAVVLLALLVAGGAYAYWNYAVAPYGQVPRMVGLSQADALERADALGFDVVITAREHDLETPAGQVLAQRPTASQLRRRGADLSITVSQGPLPVAMPKVTGRPLEQARAALSEHSFRIEVGEAFHGTIAAGRVISQNPKPQATIKQGSAVTLTVSRGIEQVAVPDLSGHTRQEAEALLAEAKLTGEFSQMYSDDVPEAGAVVSQGTEAGARVDKGSTVPVVVSLGPLTVSMPNVRGHAVTDATAELEALGLEVSVEGQARPRFGPFVRGEIGIVEEQQPQPGEALQRGDTVVLYTYSE